MWDEMLSLPSQLWAAWPVTLRLRVTCKLGQRNHQIPGWWRCFMTLKAGGGRPRGGLGETWGGAWRLSWYSPPVPALLPHLQANLWVLHPGLSPHWVCVAVPQAAMKLSTSPQSYRSLRSLQKPGHTLLFKALG